MNNSYITNTFRAPEEVKDVILGTLLSKYNKQTQQFFVHVYFCTVLNLKKDDGWVPVSWELMKKHWGKDTVDWNGLISQGLIEIQVHGEIQVSEETFIKKTYDRTKGISRRFRVTARILEFISVHTPRTVDSFIRVRFFNLMTGTRMSVFKRHQLYDENRHSIPELVKSSILCIKRCVVNFRAIQDYLYDLELNLEPKDYTNPLYKRFKVDERCYLTLLATNFKKLDNQFMEYYPSYTMQMSGRISEEGGGIQSCTRVMRELAFSGVKDIKNYDLQSSQVWSLIQFFETAGLNTEWLQDYLNVNKQVFADMVGISIKTWKDCFLALIMGCALLSEKELKSIDQFEKVDLAILNYLKQELVEDTLVLEAHLKFNVVVKPLKREIDKWHTWLVNLHIHTCMTYSKGKEYVTNKAGVKFPLWEYRKPIKDKKKEEPSWVNLNELKRKLAAFFLQGNEATFIHYLTTLSVKYNFEVVGNAHDGLITIGAIPSDAVDEAKQLSGLKYAFLIEKPFAN